VGALLTTAHLGQAAVPADIYRTKDGCVLWRQVTGHPLFIRWAG
jgi:hypothetical protein